MGWEKGNWAGDYLLLSQSSQDWGLWCTFHLMPMWLTGPKCGCSEKVHQHPLCHLGVLLLALSSCEHSLWGCFLHLAPTGLATSMQVTPLLQPEMVLPWEEGEMELTVFLYFWEALWQSSVEEHHLSDPILLSVPLSAPIPIKRWAFRWRKDWAFHPALKLL